MNLKKADFANWKLRALWSLEEGIQLLSGIEPVHNISSHFGYHSGIPRQLSKELRVRLDIGDRAVEARVLKPDFGGEYVFWATKYFPSVFLKWAQSNGWEIPSELTNMLNIPEPEPEPRGSSEEKLDPRERTTLLQIIAVLAAEAGLDLDKHSKAAEVLMTIGAKHGLELPKKKDTIASKFKEARDLKITR
jgi:hypothetical protein